MTDISDDIPDPARIPDPPETLATPVAMAPPGELDSGELQRQAQIQKARRTRISRLRDAKLPDPNLIRGIARPRSPFQWLMRRLYLEDKLELFKEFVRGADPEGQQDPSKVAWGVARRQFGFYSQAKEKARCLALEESRDEEVRRRAAIVWDQEAERNGTAGPVFGAGRESSYLEDVRWCYTHWSTYVRRRGEKEWVLTREQELIKNAPSQGAYGMVLFAAENLPKFLDLCKNVLTKIEATQDAITEEQQIDRSLEKLRAVVEGFRTPDATHEPDGAVANPGAPACDSKYSENTGT